MSTGPRPGGPSPGSSPRRAARIGSLSRQAIAVLPLGTIPVSVGLVITGITAYAYLILTARVLGPAKYAPISVLWAMVFLVGPGVFLPLQQEVGRLFAQRRVENVGAGPVARRAAIIGGGLLAFLLVVTAAAAVPLGRALFDSQYLLVVGFACALVGYLLLSLTWGVLAGSGRFVPYAVAQSADGILRLVICVVLALVGVETAGPYGLVMGLTPAIAALIAMRGNTDLLAPGPTAPWGDLSAALGWLLVGSLGAQALANASIVAVELLATKSEHAEAGNFLAGVVIARFPLFLFGAVQAALLPRLATLSRGGHYRQFRSGMSRLLSLVAVIAVVSTVAAFLVGPWALRLLFGSRFVLSRGDLTMLAAGSGAYMLALAIVQALIALGRHARSTVGWIVGLAVFVTVTALGSALLARVELGFVCGSFAALVVAAVLLRVSMPPAEQEFDAQAMMLPVAELGIEP
jgi:O-antigen/teichoic acid export membrane protein